MSEPEFTLYGHPRSGNVYKAALMLALTGTPFTMEIVDLPGGEQRGEAYRAKNPFGKVPMLVHGNTVVRQSNSILLYLAAHSGTLGSGGDAAMRLRISEWMFFEQDLLFPGIGRRRFQIKVADGPPEVIAFLGTLGNAALDTMEAALGRSTWLAGDDPTIADVCLYAYARLAEEADYDLSGRPNVRAWRKRVESLPGWGPPEALVRA